MPWILSDTGKEELQGNPVFGLQGHLGASGSVNTYQVSLL